MKNIKNNLSKIAANKFAAWFLIPIILLSFWIICSLLFNNKVSFSVLLFPQNRSLIVQVPQEKILKGEKITGNFTARENNLGLIMMKFNNYVKPDYADEDILVFSIKEKGSKSWYYKGNYHSGAFEHLTYFPFGFTPINNSKDKIYQFQLVSLNGNSSNAIELSKSNSIFQTGYQFSKRDIIGDKSFLIKFILEKIEISFTNLDFLLSSIIYLLPFLFYLLWQVYKYKRKIIKKYITVFTLILIAIDILFLKTLYIGVLVGLIVFWIISIKLKRLENSVSFTIAFIFLFAWITLMYIGFDSYSDKFNVWTYTFLVIGTFQVVIEEKKKPENLITYKEFFKNLFKFNGKL